MSKRAGTWRGAWVVVVGLIVAAEAASAQSPQAIDLLPELKTPGLGADAGAVPAGPAPAPGPGYWLGGSRSIGLGLDLSRIQPNTSSTLVSAPSSAQGVVTTRLIDPDLNLDALSFGLKVRWPAVTGAGRSSLQPYFSFGPALFVERPSDVIALGLPADRRDLSLSLGMIGGAGLSWQLGEHAALFGEYRFTQPASSRLLPFAGQGMLGRDADTSSLLYGVSVRF